MNNPISDSNDMNEKSRLYNLVIGSVLGIALYAFFTLRHFLFPENSTATSIASGLIGLLYVGDFIMTMSLLGIVEATRKPSEYENSDKISQTMIASYYPPGTTGRLVEKAYLFLVTVPYYFVIAFVFQNLPLLIALFWARLNMVVFENLQGYYYGKQQPPRSEEAYKD